MPNPTFCLFKFFLVKKTKQRKAKHFSSTFLFPTPLWHFITTFPRCYSLCCRTILIALVCTKLVIACWVVRFLSMSLLYCGNSIFVSMALRSLTIISVVLPLTPVHLLWHPLHWVYGHLFILVLIMLHDSLLQSHHSCRTAYLFFPWGSASIFHPYPPPHGR